MQTQSQSREQTHKRSTHFEIRVQQLLLKRARAPEGYHSLLRSVYSDGYDRETAEAVRQQIVKGDSSWMPPVRFIDHETLGEARGAYDKASGVVFLADDLRPHSWRFWKSWDTILTPGCGRRTPQAMKASYSGVWSSESTSPRKSWPASDKKMIAVPSWWIIRTSRSSFGVSPSS